MMTYSGAAILLASLAICDAFVTLPIHSRKNPLKSPEHLARLQVAAEANGVSVPVKDWIAHTADLQVCPSRLSI